jgi:hypothetical protein
MFRAPACLVIAGSLAVALLGGATSFAQTPAPSPAATAAATPPLTVAEIVQKAVARDDTRRERRMAFEADQTIVIDRLDDTGKIIKTKTLHAVLHPTREISYSANVDSTSESQHSDEDAAKAQHIMAIMNLGKLAPRFIEKLAGEGVIQGRACYIVHYQPKTGQPSADTREEKVVNNLAGRFWIAKDNLDIVQSDGSLVSPVTVALVASVTRMDFQFRSQLLPNGDVGPASFSVNLAVHAPFYDFRQRQVTSLANWRPKKT